MEEIIFASGSVPVAVAARVYSNVGAALSCKPLAAA